MSFAAVLSDLDGVLVDSAASIERGICWRSSIAWGRAGELQLGKGRR
jgi:phosphoglycolate phosphatase-like HAD superfamily hydrolase